VPKGLPLDTPKVDYALALRQVENLLDRLEKWKNPTRVLLLNNGCDHAPAQPKVPDMIEYVNEKQSRATLVQGTFEDFVVALREDVGRLAPVSGELHEGMEVGLLSGIFSTRMYLKQANASAQTVLEKLSEPLCTFAWTLRRDYPAAFLQYAWKELLKCHPHDDIGGCSVDPVHEDDVGRFRRVEQVGKTLAREALDHIAHRIRCPAGKAILVYNPLSFPNSGEVRLSCPLRRRDLPSSVQVLDPSGARVPAVIRWSDFPENLPTEKRSDFGELRIAFLAENVPSCGYRLYTLEESGETQPDARLTRRSRTIENEFFTVAANSDGTVNLKDRETGITFKGLHFFEDVEDAGDEYDYSPLPASRSMRITSQRKPARIAVVRSAPYKQSIEVSLELRVPRGLTPDRTARSRRTVPLPVRSTVTLYRGIRRVDFETTVENRASDHRLRAGFPTGIHAASAHAESKFDVVRRPLRFPRYTEKYRQPPVPTQHVETFVDVHDGRRGFALLNDGLPEYEAREEAEGVTLYQTLFRSVGWLSRGDLLTRKEGGAGPAIATPGAQMPGVRTFRYSVVPHYGSWQDAALWQAGLRFTCPMAAQLCEASNGTLPPELSFLSIEPETIPISAIKKSESGQGMIVRFYNPGSRKVRARLRFFRPIARAYLVRLDETRLKPLRIVGGNSVVVHVGSKEIITVELRLRP
jgi:alpha-mannosidase